MISRLIIRYSRVLWYNLSDNRGFEMPPSSIYPGKFDILLLTLTYDNPITPVIFWQKKI